MESSTSFAEHAPRPFKRRKQYRRKDEAEDTDAHEEVAPHLDKATAVVEPLSSEDTTSNHKHTQSHGGRPDFEDEQSHISKLLRRRKATQRKRGGVEFTVSTNASLPAEVPNIDEKQTDNDEMPQEIRKVVERFAPQTGQIANVDKHMVAYIDSEMAKRRRGSDSATYTSNGQVFLRNGTLIDAGLNRQPASLGRLHEIDLGPDSKLRNIARTEAAQKRLENGEAEVEEGAGKVRLGRDGKPRRGKRRRNSEDIKRDKLVEEVMRESRLEIYDEPEPDTGNDDQAADDRIAEQFRRDFMDAISSRRQRAHAARKAKGAKSDDRPRGPKLGGSRSARAAMHEMQKQKQAAKKK